MKLIQIIMAEILLVLLVLNTAHAADYSYTSITYPGATSTWAYGVNDAGTVVGYYEDSKYAYHGFSFSNGTYSAIDYPGAYYTWAYGINNDGMIVGQYVDMKSKYHGFTLSNGTYTTLDHPDSTITRHYGISNAGGIVGQYNISSGDGHDYYLSGGSWTDLYCGINNAAGTGVNRSGTIVGMYYNLTLSRLSGFTKNGGSASCNSFDYPDAGATWVAYGINDAGTIVGYFKSTGTFTYHGFILSNGAFTTFNYPKAGATYVTGINNAGTVVGYCVDKSLHGFLAAQGVTLSGTVTADQCTDTSCSSSPFPDVVINVTSDGASLQATTASDGTYSVQVAPDKTYTLTPSFTDVNFFPNSLTTTPTGSVTDLDFSACVEQLPKSGTLTPGFMAQGFALKNATNKCDPDGIDWSMPDKMVAGKQFNEASASRNGLLGHDAIYPPGGWEVNLYLIKNKQKIGECNNDPLVEWRWEVTPSANVSTKPAAGCTSSMTVKQLGIYNVTAKKYTRSSTSLPFTFPRNGVKRTQKVLVRDFLIVGLGDSNASGEGNPPWIYGKCDRSQASYQFMTSLYVEQRDPHSSVTFLFPACSGARIEHVYSMPYGGTNPDSNGALDPQVTQVAKLLRLTGAAGEPKKPRNVDAVILSAGVNNLYFGALVEFCLRQGDGCQNIHARLEPKTGGSAGVGDMRFVADPTSKTTVSDIVTGLQNNNLNYPWYMGLKTALTKPVAKGGLGVAANHVFITQYPDFSYDFNGNICDTTGKTFSNVPKWGTATWAWFSKQAGVLNSNVAKTATYHWQTATPDQTLFKNHGYCAGDFTLTFYPWWPFYDTVPSFGKSYFLGVVQGVRNRNIPGGFHPIKAGHGITANAVKPLICNALFGNTTCTGPPTK